MTTTSRWTLILLAAGAATAGLLFAMQGPADGPPAAEPVPPVSLLNLPVTASASAASAAPVVLPVRPAASSAARQIGSEGYGPHIERAQAGTDATAAWEAVQWLRSCVSTEGRRLSFETLRNQGVSPDMMTQLMVETDAEERRCQTVTAQHRALLPELAARAMRAGVPEAASAYANSLFPSDLNTAQRQEVADAMRRDASAGHAQSLLGALVANDAWGLSDAEKLGYLVAYGSLPDQPGAQAMAKSLIEQGTIRFKSVPTPEQMAAAKLAGQQIVERARANSRP